MSKENIKLFTRISHGGQFAYEHGSHAVEDDQSVACCCVAHGADGFSGWGVVFCLFRQVDLANLLHKFKQTIRSAGRKAVLIQRTCCMLSRCRQITSPVRVAMIK